MDFITIPRKAAAIKIAAAKKAVYRFKLAANQYERDVTVAELVQAFRSDQRMRLRVRLSDSAHFVTVPHPTAETIYHIEF